MVKIAEINKDIEAIAKETGISVFTYEEVHNADVPNKFHYDYNLVINRYAKDNNISEEQAKGKLIRSGYLRMLPNGEYEVDFGIRTRNGGGSYSNSLDALFTFSHSDIRANYHELAHAIQAKSEPFDNDYVEDRFQSLVESENKNINATKIQTLRKFKQKRLDDILELKEDFLLYLREMHAEAFAFSAMLLRSEDKNEFNKMATLIYSEGVRRTSGSVIYSWGEADYKKRPHKFYSSKQITYEIIKQLNALQKQNKLGDFFRSDGVIDTKKLSDFCAEIVDKKAYSPRALQSFFENKLFTATSSEDRLWQKDALKSLVLRPAAKIIFKVYDYLDHNKSSRIQTHRELLAQQQKEELDFASKREVYDDPELTALREIQRLEIKLRYMPAKQADMFRNDLQSLITIGFTDEEISSQFNRCMPEKKGLLNRFLPDKSREKQQQRFNNNLLDIMRLLSDNADNPYFVKLINSEFKTVERKLPLLLEDKLNNPQKDVINNVYIPKKSVENNTPQRLAENFAKQHDLDDFFVANVMNLILEKPQKLRDKTELNCLRAKCPVEEGFLGVKGRKFAAELEDLMDNIATLHYQLSSNPVYNKDLEYYRKDLHPVAPIQIVEEETMDIKRGLKQTQSAALEAENNNAPWMRGRLGKTSEQDIKPTKEQKKPNAPWMRGYHGKAG